MTMKRMGLLLGVTLIATVSGCGAIPDELAKDLAATARTAAEDAAQQMVQDVVNYVGDQVLQGAGLPSVDDLTTDGLPTDAAP